MKPARANSALLLSFIITALLGGATLGGGPARAAILSSTHTRVINYHCGMNDMNRSGFPYTAELTLKIHPSGIVDGTWKSDSIRPDPMNGRIEFISGGITGKYLHFSVGARGTLSVQGEFKDGNVREITGSASFRHRRYNFVAHRVT